jgi:hypothetical protein
MNNQTANNPCTAIINTHIGGGKGLSSAGEKREGNQHGVCSPALEARREADHEEG